MRASRLLPALFAAFVLALLPRGAEAQNLAQIYHVSPAPGADLESAIAEHARWREANGDPWTWEIYQVAQGEDLGDFYIRSGGHAWADWDTYEQSEFARSADEHYASTMGPAVGEITSWIAMGDTAHQRLPESMENIQFFNLIRWNLKADKVQDFQDAIDKIHDAIVQTEWPVHYTFVSPVVGTEAPQMGLVIFYEDWAAFEGPERQFDEMMGEVYGEEAQAIFEQLGASYWSEETMVLRIRPDLSVNLGN